MSKFEDKLVIFVDKIKISKINCEREGFIALIFQFFMLNPIIGSLALLQHLHIYSQGHELLPHR